MYLISDSLGQPFGLGSARQYYALGLMHVFSVSWWVGWGLVGLDDQQLNHLCSVWSVILQQACLGLFTC